MMFCADCGSEVQASAGFCPKCGQPRTRRPVVRTGFVVALLFVFFAGLGVVIYLVRADAAAVRASVPQSRLHVETVPSTFSVPTLRFHAFTVLVPPGAQSAVLQGHFAATGGQGDDIEFSLMSNDDFVNWENRHAVMPLYTTGRVTQAAIHASLGQPGTYYLVFDNRFSLLSPKAIQDDLTLTYRQ